MNPAASRMTCGNSPNQTPQNPAEPQVSKTGKPRSKPRRTPQQVTAEPRKPRSPAGFENSPQTTPELPVCGVAGFGGVSQVVRHNAYRKLTRRTEESQ